MKTMIWKELRENFKWALLAFLGLLFAQIYVLSTQRDNFGGMDDYSLCSSGFLMTTSFGCSIIGAALGVVQILPELRRDRWAALLHRPVPRGVIFFGKAIPGLALYLLATLPPLLASACYVAIPGKFPGPFVPGLLLPGLSDLLLGVVFYFAAMLICLHRGRWFGARGLILFAVAPVFLLHTTAGNAFLVLPLVASLILMLAAWGTLLGNGPVKSMPRLGRMSYILVVLAGALTALILLGTCRELVPVKSSPQVMSCYPRFQVATDGRVFDQDKAGEDGNLTDIDGNVITDERYLGNDSRGNYCRFIPLSSDLKKDAYWADYRSRIFPRDSDHYVSAVSASYYFAEFWYLLVHNNYLVGYDTLSGRYVGFFDREGFKSPGEKPLPFSAPLRMAGYSDAAEATLIISGSKVYAFDFANRRMRTFFDAGNGMIFVAESFGISYSSPNRVAVALENEIRIFDSAGKPLGAIPYPHDPGRWGNISISTNKALDRIYLQSRDSGAFTGAVSLPDFLDEFDLQGHLLRTYSRPAPVHAADPPRWEDRLTEDFAPLGPYLMAEIYAHFDSLARYEYAAAQLPDSLTSGKWGELSVIALVLAAITFLWARKTGFSKGEAVRWAAFSFVFGPAGLLTFRLATDWPVRIRCHSCGKGRAIEREQCMHCHQPWTLPESNGTEILDGAGSGCAA